MNSAEPSDSVAEPHVPSPSGPIDEGLRKQAGTAHSETAAVDSASDFTKQIKRAERWMIALTFALAIASFLGTVISFGAWQSMREQAALTKQQLDLMKDQTTAMVGQLAVMKDQLGEMHSSSQQLERSIAAYEDTATANEILACAMKYQARARLQVKVERERNMNQLASMEVVVSIQNVGNTPAYNVSRYGALGVGPHPLLDFITTFMQLESNKKEVERIQKSFGTDNLVLQPGQLTTFAYSSNNSTQQDITNWRSMSPKERDQKRFYIDGQIKYTDVYGTAHYNNYCVAYSWNSVAAVLNNPTTDLNGVNCDGFNNTDVDAPCP
jgi:hypothetical protein